MDSKKEQTKYLISCYNKRFWEAIHAFNSAPIWRCIISSSWPINPKNRRSDLFILVKNDSIFKVLAKATNLKCVKQD